MSGTDYDRENKEYAVRMMWDLIVAREAAFLRPLNLRLNPDLNPVSVTEQAKGGEK